MAIIDDRTGGRDYPLPNPANNASDDVLRLIEAFTKIDADVVALIAGLAEKAAAGHTHEIAQVIGLVDALAGKAASDHEHGLDDLTDVDVSAAANGRFLKLVGDTWIAAKIVLGDIDQASFTADAIAETASRIWLTPALKAAYDAKADLAGASFTGRVTAPDLTFARAPRLDSDFSPAITDIHDINFYGAYRAITGDHMPADGSGQWFGYALGEGSNEYQAHLAMRMTGTGASGGSLEPELQLIRKDAGVWGGWWRVAMAGESHTKAEANAAFATSGHGHPIADISGLQAALNGKSGTGHTHPAGDITSGTLAMARLALATGAQAQNGASNSVLMTPLRTAQAISAQVNVGVQNVRLGASVSALIGNGGISPSGHALTRIIYSTQATITDASARPIQRQINGTWATVSQVV